MYFFSQNSFFVINLFLFYFEEKHIFFNKKHDLHIQTYYDPSRNV